MVPSFRLGFLLEFSCGFLSANVNTRNTNKLQAQVFNGIRYKPRPSYQKYQLAQKLTKPGKTIPGSRAYNTLFAFTWNLPTD